MRNKDSKHRQYLRISTVLPVEFYILDSKDKRLSPWLQGFTSDIGKGGICLSINDLWWGFWDKLQDPKIKLYLRIDSAFKSTTLEFRAKVSWSKLEKLPEFNKATLGLEFFGKNTNKATSLFKFAIFKKAVPIATAVIIVCLFFLASNLFFHNSLLIKKNRNLVKDYVGILEEDSNLKQILDDKSKTGDFIKERREDLKATIDLLNQEVVQRNEQKQMLRNFQYTDNGYRSKLANLEKELKLFEQELAALKREDSFLKLKQEQVLVSLSEIQQQTKNLQTQKLEVSKKVIEGLYAWIGNRQNLSSGLVLSYEGDSQLDKVCFTYDQALAAIVFLLNDDNSRAKKIMDFYLKKIDQGENIQNAYFTKGSVFEYVIHSGPNAWIGLAALNYVKKTGDETYLEIAESVGELLLSLMDEEGGVPGGPGINWYSTEHNLDSYAFFTLFYEITGQTEYKKAAQRVKNWIGRNSYTEGAIPIKRGKGDSTIATDTYTWSVTAFGPKQLEDLKMNPETIIEFALNNCEVNVKFKRREGEVSLRGFDFAKAKNIARGGVVSGEWTSQMILAFEIMADYYKTSNPKKSNDYLNKAKFYFNELQKMIITSISKVGREDPCLPYASSSSVDTGHGWRTPKGDRTGSLASTAYFLIAFQGYNPLRSEYLSLSLKNIIDEN
tara:strand:+ start:12714 stop:14714 length:2001 start_codon:yes stop_codon:yes gene_type:complete